MDFPSLASEERGRRLEAPSGICRVVLDTDTYNEIDEQFAVAHALLSPEQVGLEAIYATPFYNNRPSGSADGMEKSHEEIERLLDRMKVADGQPVFRGAERFLPGRSEGVDNPASCDLIGRARASDELLYCRCVRGDHQRCIRPSAGPGDRQTRGRGLAGRTARPLALRPRVQPPQDVFAAQVVMNSGVPFVQVPCAALRYTS